MWISPPNSGDTFLWTPQRCYLHSWSMGYPIRLAVRKLWVTSSQGQTKAQPRAILGLQFAKNAATVPLYALAMVTLDIIIHRG
jgi:hypothetical protein